MKLTTTRLARAVVAVTAATALGLAPGVAVANAAGNGVAAAPVTAKKPAPTSVPVTGTLSDGTAFTGTVSDLSTSVVDGVLQLSGTLTGTGLPAEGVDFTTPVAAAVEGGCSILNLDLGPIHLDLLGLVVDLNEINLDITAVPGAGDLLGNLLCAVAGLLDRGGPLAGISALLDRLLTGLGL